MAPVTDATKPERRGRPTVPVYGSQEVPSKVGALSSGAPGIVDALPPGAKVSRYEIVRLIGEGGMGTVYEAMDSRLGRKVALKVLSPALKSKRKAAKRFCIEAQAAARLVHPNVVGIFDFEVDCECPYMAMEHLQGETLAAAIARGPFAFDRLADIMLAVCAGVFAAHQAGIIHRDLKPSNIFLCPDWKGNQTARVLDFGISKVGGLSSSDLTQTGDIVGTSQYLSPEQASGNRQVTELSDQYSLGVVMYECLTQQTPQRGQPIYGLLQNIVEGRHVPVRELRPDLPLALETVVGRAMQIRPTDRFASVLDLARALFPFASSKGQRQFADFCGLAKSTAGARRAPADNVARRRPDDPLPATERLSAEESPSWQRQATRTSAHSSRRSSRRRTQANPRENVVRPSGARKVVVSIALGAVLAFATLAVLSFFVRL